MKSLELQSTKANLFNTFEKDTIDRNKDIFHFVNLLNYIEDNCSIALDGEWGCGKTFFVKQVKMVLDAYNEYIDFHDEAESIRVRACFEKSHPKVNDLLIDIQPQISIYYDAWSNDNDIDPILSLVYVILQSVSTDYSFKQKHDYLKIAASIIDFFTGKNTTVLTESFKRSDFLESLKNQKDVHNLVTDFLESLLIERGNRLVIFIDELDRCKPSYSVQLLERIKHYFNNERITFAFSINTEELQHTINRYYGDGFDSCKYLDRFFDLKLSLPPINLDKYFEYIGFNSSDNIFDFICGKVIKQYHFEMREIVKFVRLTKIAAYKPTHDYRYDWSFPSQKGVLFCLMYIVPIMIGLKIKSHSLFSSFINGHDSSPMIEILSSEEISIYKQFLRQNETFDPKENNSSLLHIKPEDKLQEIYNALFVELYDKNETQKYIGSVSFNKSTRAYLLRIISLLSDFADFDIK